MDKRKDHTSFDAAGFTLVETMIAMAVAVITGGMVFLFLNSGMTLYAKNTAVNAAHQQARSSVDQMLANIHAAVSIPQLVDENLSPVPAPGPAVGVSFQRFEMGPFLLWTGAGANVPASQTYLYVYAPALASVTDITGLRFNVSSHKVEKDISAITPIVAGYFKIDFATPVGTAIIVNNQDDNGSGNGNGNGNGTSNIVGFTTRRVSYAVVGGELRYYPANNLQQYKVIARNVTSPTPGQTPAPFKMLQNESGALDLRSVAAVDLSTAEPSYSQRGYAAVNMFINSYIPFRSRLTVYQ